jgi:hypothetical protein
MKKIYFILIFIFSISGIFSQNVRYGITGSGNICNLYGQDKPISYIKQYGFSGGFFIDARTAEHLSTQTEIVFNRFQFQFSEKLDNSDEVQLNVSECNDYISVPVMLKYKRGYEIAFTYITLGAQVSLLVHHKRDVTATSRDLEIDALSYYNYKNNWYDYGLNGGIGFQFKPLTIGIQTYVSMRTIYKKEEAKMIRFSTVGLNCSWQFNYKNPSPFGRKTGWKGIKYKLNHLF